jgi:peptide/nickel transport system substrate-binding protein
MSDRLGQQLGNYRLVALLGEGGFAEVYLGQHLRLDLQAAIKVLHAHLTGKEAEHFQQEAQTIAKLVHPTIVRILDYDVQEGVPFLVMDYAPHGSLRQRHPRGEVVPLPQTASYVKQVAEALQYAHEHKVVHRDIKPENMLLGRREEVLLSDFGIATVAHSTGSLSAEAAVGTIAYMAPEQIQGHTRPASDQYALGVTVYEWLCGARPFSGSFTELVTQHLWQPPPSLQERAPAIRPAVEQVVLRALAKDPKERFATVTAFAAALEQASQEALLPAAPGSPGLLTEAVPPASRSAVPTELAISSNPSQLPTELDTPQEQATDLPPPPRHSLAPTEPIAAATPVPAEVPLLPTPPGTRQRRGVARTSTALLIGLAVLVIAGGILGSLSLLAHFGVIGPRSGSTTPSVVRGGTWTDDFFQDPDSLISNGGRQEASALIDQALYLPLFYGDAQGVVHPGAATEVPTVQNGDISADSKTWTFHLRPHLVWSDGQPYDARDVDYTWQLWHNPKFGAADPVGSLGLDLISGAEVSADDLSITFHLKQAYAPFLSLWWVDGILAPLPAHHFSAMAPEAILKSPDNLNPQITSGPFLMRERLPGDHYTLVRNPRYYRASEGLPYLDKVVFRIVDQDAILQDLQVGAIDSAWLVDVRKVPVYQRLSNYTLVTPPTSSAFEAMYFNFHNQVLASHPEVRQAMAMAIDHQALIEMARQGIASPLCTDHGSALHPGYESIAGCPVFDPAAANKLLADNDWVKGPDGVRTRGGQRLEFEYSTALTILPWRTDGEAIIERNFKAIGIQLDIQNYPGDMFFGFLLPGGKASPPTGAVAGRYDIAEFAVNWGYDPDDSSLLSCDQIPPTGATNIDFYCNPALDALYKQELATADPGLRQQLFNQIHQIYLTELPFIVLFGAPIDFAMVRKGTHNYQHSPIEGGTVNIWEWWCDKGKC